MNPLVSYLVARLKERSTWLGIIALVTSSAVAVFPASSSIIMAAGASLGGFISAVLPDATK